MSAIIKYPVVVFKQNSDPGFLHGVKTFLGHRMKPGDLKIDMEAFEILVRNHPVKQVREFIKQYNNGLAKGGHGGFLGHPSVVEREIDLKQELRKVTAERDALEQELESERQHEADLGDKWGAQRRDFEQDNDDLRKKVRSLNTSIRKLEEEHDLTVLEGREKRRQQMLRWRQTPLWKVGWQRLLALVNSRREG